MKWHASGLPMLLLAVCANSAPAPQDASLQAPPPADAGEARYDAVGWAGAAPSEATGVFVVHPTLPVGSFVELTRLDVGRVLILKVGAQGPVAPGYLVALSPVAAQAFGVGSEPAAVRIRQVMPAPGERAAAEGGSLNRLDAPQVLLAALRKRLPVAPTGAPQPVTPSSNAAAPPPVPGPQAIETVELPPSKPTALPGTQPAPASPPPPPTALAAPPAATPPATGGWVVQVAALSDADRAEALARRLGGFTVRAGRLVRVRMGPYPNTAAAERGRAQAAASGYGDATILRND
ncbi:SPOR domain-containing protein [Sphingomonas sp. ac-8]|uniref:SPOR domain-containing protein n=1 Tax=Sphingomonas sp. ac-8 TaxID=3242977 RepID=UPI003A7F9B90